ncbi:unnamed protein product, partial [Heterotrigona itama]
VRELFRTWREDSERRSKDVVDLWESKLMGKVDQLGSEKYLVLEQVCIAAFDCARHDVAEYCIKILKRAFPSSLRVHKYYAMHLEALELYDEALEVLDSIIKRDETTAAPRKRRVAILKAKGRIPEAIKELTEYLKKFMSDQEAWHELCDLYLQEQEYSKAAFCMEELILHNPHSHLIYQRYAEIKYSQATNNIATSPKCPSPKKKDAIKLSEWAANQIEKQYESKVSDEDIKSLEGLLGQLQLEI